MGNPEQMFKCSPVGIDCALRQGEILTNVIELQIKLEIITSVDDDSAYSANPVKHPYAVIVSQDCDLQQDFNYRYHDIGNQRHELPSVLLCQAQDVDKFSKSELYRSLFESRTFEGYFKKNNEFRYHFIQEIPAKYDACNKALPELGIDFKRYFSMPTAEVYHRIKLTHTERRSMLKPPYRDHFCDRFYSFNKRIALPEEYESI